MPHKLTMGPALIWNYTCPEATSPSSILISDVTRYNRHKPQTVPIFENPMWGWGRCSKYTLESKGSSSRPFLLCVLWLYCCGLDDMENILNRRSVLCHLVYASWGTCAGFRVWCGGGIREACWSHWKRHRIVYLRGNIKRYLCGCRKNFVGKKWVMKTCWPNLGFRFGRRNKICISF